MAFDLRNLFFAGGGGGGGGSAITLVFNVDTASNTLTANMTPSEVVSVLQENKIMLAYLILDSFEDDGQYNIELVRTYGYDLDLMSGFVFTTRTIYSTLSNTWDMQLNS